MSQDKQEAATECENSGPQSDMERMFLEVYLRDRGYRLSQLSELPTEQARALMTEACRYASLKLAQIESTAHFRETIREPG